MSYRCSSKLCIRKKLDEFFLVMIFDDSTNEPRHEKTNVLVSEPGCTAPEDG